MKNIILILSLFNLIKLISYSQCDMKQLIPLDFGISKYESIGYLNSLSNLKKQDIYEWYDENPFIERPTNVDINESRKWFDCNGLRDDSILIVILYYTILYNPCFLTYEGTLRIAFADNKLYSYNILISYPVEQYSVIKENYLRLSKLFQDKYPFKENRSLINSKTEEQIGESTYFYLNDSESKSTKSERIEISKFLDLNDKNQMNIEIHYVNFKVTKLDNTCFSY